MDRSDAAGAFADGHAFRLLGRCVSGTFVVYVVLVATGRRRPFDEREWRDALVVVERGQVELECERGGRRRFATGAVLCFAGMPLRFLHQRGPDPALLVSVRRRAGRA